VGKFLIALWLIALFLMSLTPVTALENIPLRFNQPGISVLEGGAQDQWVFEGKAGQVIVLSAERFPPDPYSQLDPLLELYDPGDNLLASDDDFGPGKDSLLLNIPLPADGTYATVVKNMTTWEGGSYRLSLAESSLPSGCQTPAGEMFISAMPSAIQGYPVPYRVFMPPCYELTHLRYPYVILLHGSNSSDELWDSLGVDEAIVRGVALGRLPPMAVVMPWGGELANTNTFGAGASWEYVVTDELIPFVESVYCLQNIREGRAIGGISRGGFWAFEIAFRHPESFSALGGHSPYFDLYHAPPTHNPLDLAQAPPPQPLFRLWMDRGKDDYAQLNIDRQHDNLTANNIPHTFMVYPVGEHENAYWSAHVDEYLRFYSETWRYDTYPLCD
jgi:enterochelin esterase-like enzyme